MSPIRIWRGRSAMRDLAAAVWLAAVHLATDPTVARSSMPAIQTGFPIVSNFLRSLVGKRLGQHEGVIGPEP